jgi:hypothetical protein
MTIHDFQAHTTILATQLATTAFFSRRTSVLVKAPKDPPKKKPPENGKSVVNFVV